MLRETISRSSQYVSFLQAERGASARVVTIGGKLFEEQEQQWRQSSDEYIDRFDFSRIQNLPTELNSKDKFTGYLQNFRQEVNRNEISISISNSMLSSLLPPKSCAKVMCLDILEWFLVYTYLYHRLNGYCIATFLWSCSVLHG